jgi:hypothetical protein
LTWFLPRTVPSSKKGKTSVHRQHHDGTQQDEEGVCTLFEGESIFPTSCNPTA